MDRDSFFLLKYKWEYGGYSLHEIFNMVKENKITEEEFHEITRYNYKGIKKTREWD